ncbi:MAG: DegT/DnrJ/EryC1/StrS family aminotransferase [Candidatus Eisenbacteria bacterium]|uniref:DegT/DnrJ/EryC1/StrS family aminotransferase n=1 Tax=Eiseniibacteriota bacterium TaxID=2212470 RepID=A0A956SC99_UNCEI|nr:DegT/DnrJ/EryC1/StrS family aminotransferase [Candidatus Eisenbacteria bacterium]MCB9463020.1 DegT/DnrJ/EryC1/StrS family aminotransferase [Candidatus Eisenbacteria bacterium]
MDIPLCDLKAQYASIASEIDPVVREVIASTRYIGGPEVSAFEEEFARYCGAAHCVGVASGTAALHLAFIGAGVGPGDEVVTVSHTFIATAEPIVTLGAKVKFVDIDEKTYNMDVNQLEAAITEKTKLLLPVHIYGQPADMDPVLEIAAAKGIQVIEDSAQSHGARYKGERTCGGIAPMGTFSFYPGKNLGAYGDAGAITCADAEVAERMRSLSNHGRADKYLHDEEGFNFRLDALQAAILRIKLRHLPDWTEGRRRVAKMYDERLAANDKVVTPYVAPFAEPVYHLYVVRVPNRDHVLAGLRDKGIDAGIHYPVPLHLQPAYRYLGYEEGALPVTEKIAKEIVSLPIFPEMTESQVDRVVETLESLL